MLAAPQAIGKLALGKIIRLPPLPPLALNATIYAWRALTGAMQSSIDSAASVTGTGIDIGQGQITGTLPSIRLNTTMV